MFKLLLLRVFHDGAGGRIFFKRYPLLIPTDGFSLFDERRYHPCERTSFLRKFRGGFMVLIGSHGGRLLKSVDTVTSADLPELAKFSGQRPDRREAPNKWRSTDN